MDICDAEKMLENARVWRHVSVTHHDAIGEAYWHGSKTRSKGCAVAG
jgi:hypothetical protein